MSLLRHDSAEALEPVGYATSMVAVSKT